MRVLRFSTAFALTAAFSAAYAGQIFSFENPIPNGSYDDAMFQSVSLFPGSSSPVASLQNLYAGTVTLQVTSFSDTGVQLGSTQSYAARYYLSNSANALSNGTFQGNRTSGSYATGAGLLTFVSPTNSAVLLQISFSASRLAYGNFAGAGTIGFSGGLLTTGEKGNENLSFGFPNRYTASGSPSDGVGRSTGTFTSSIGVVGVPTAAPAPPAILAFALGFLRRKRAKK